MDKSNATINTSIYQSDYCAYRLPCGICEKLEKQCLKQSGWTTSGPTITMTTTGTIPEAHYLDTQAQS